MVKFMKLVFISFFYPPDLCAGSFRASALVSSLEKKLADSDELHIITTIPNRYGSHQVTAPAKEVHGKVTIYRLNIPPHSGTKSQVRSFIVYFFKTVKLCSSLKPDFLINTNGRMMSGLLTSLLSVIYRCGYYIDIRDIFSETISDIYTEKNKTLASMFKWLFSGIEKFVLGRAKGVNVVSKAFTEYYENLGIDTKHWDSFPNGIDKEFLLGDATSTPESDICKIVYAGNIGKGQGLEKIIPEVAQKLGEKFQFIIVGDGGIKHLLVKEISIRKIQNVELKLPVNRNELIKIYQSASILFLHLNNIPAFLRVLPSKIFEYTAMQKPIVAGLDGYSAEFLNKEVAHSFVFLPGDVNKCTALIRHASSKLIDVEQVDKFIYKYSRQRIMDGLSDSILKYTVR